MSITSLEYFKRICSWYGMRNEKFYARETTRRILKTVLRIETTELSAQKSILLNKIFLACLTCFWLIHILHHTFHLRCYHNIVLHISFCQCATETRTELLLGFVVLVFVFSSLHFSHSYANEDDFLFVRFIRLSHSLLRSSHQRLT